MYEAPPPEPTTPHRACLMVVIQGLFVFIPCIWWTFVLYAGVAGNLVTNALGLPNDPFWIKIASSVAVALAGTLPMLGLIRWWRRRRR